VERNNNQQQDKFGLLNDAKDKIAKQWWDETKDMKLPPQQIISDHEWNIWINNRKITGDTLNMVRRHIQETKMSEWLAADRKHGREPRLSPNHLRTLGETSCMDNGKGLQK
jgi:hypothetical protein